MSVDLRHVKALSVELHGRRIGVINRLAGDHQLFSFEDDYIKDANRPTLSLSFKGEGGTLYTKPRTYSARVPPFFSNLLPEGPLRAYLAGHAGVKPEREFFLLAALGSDLPGAVTVAPIDERGETPPHDETEDRGGGRGEERALRFSLAGLQLKFSAIQEAAGGLTIRADGMGGSWIVKLPTPQYPEVPENEFVMLELAQAVGIDVPTHRLLRTEEIGGLPRDAAHLEGNALAIERFDRGPGGERIHMEDFAQVFGLFPDDKYERRSYANIAAVLWAETGEPGTWEFVRRLAFSVLTGNGDMHLKNWTLLYADRKTPALAPAYDLVSTVPYIPEDELGLGFGGSKSLAEITKEQVRRFADTAGLPMNPLWNIVSDTVGQTVEQWQRLDSRELLSKKVSSAVAGHLEAAAASTLRPEGS